MISAFGRDKNQNSRPNCSTIVSSTAKIWMANWMMVPTAVKKTFSETSSIVASR